MLQSQLPIANTLLASLARAQYQLLLPHLEEVTLTVDIVTGVAELRESALALIDKYRDIHWPNGF